MQITTLIGPNINALSLQLCPRLSNLHHQLPMRFWNIVESEDTVSEFE